MTIVLNGSSGITNDGGYTGDGVVFADTTPANTLVTTTGGNVGIGTSSPGGRVHAVSAPGTVQVRWSDATNGTANLDTASGVSRVWSNVALAFGTGAESFTERARIDSSGNLLVGTTSGSGRLHVKTAGNTGGDWGAQIVNSSGTFMFALLNNGNFYTGSAAGSPYNATTGAGANCVIDADQGRLLRSTSSLKYKTDVQDAAHGLAQVMALRPVTYKGINDGDKVFGGLIAEEVHEAGLTEFVQYAEDGTPDALAYANMVSLAFKAIQEQQAIITALTARVEALEGTQP